MFYSWLHWWLGMRQCSWSTSLLPLWCRCGLGSSFLSRVLCHKHGCSTFCLLQRRAEGSNSFFYGLKVYQVLKCIEGCQCSMGTVLCHNGLSTSGSRVSRMVTQALRMRKEPDAHPRPVLLQTWNESLTWSAEQTSDYWWSGTSTGSACEIIHNRLAFPKVCTWLIPKHLTELHKEQCLDMCEWFLDHCGAEGDTSWKESSWEMKHGSAIMSQTLNTRIWNWNILILPPRRNSEQIHL